MVNDLLVDRRGALWIATSRGGAVRVDDVASSGLQVERFGQERGLTSKVVNCLAEDAAGDILFGHPRGVDRLHLGSGAVEHLTTAEGLTNNVIVKAYRDRSGAVWFGSLHGVSRLAPGTGSPPAPPAALWLGARVGGMPLPASPLGASELPPVRLRALSDRFEADVAAVALAQPQNLQYEFMLEGLDTSWSRPTLERTVVFSALPSGSYRLLVRARLAGAREPGVVAVLPLEVVPPLWRRGWFLALIALSLLAGGIALHRLRLGRLLQAERVRTRIAADLHDDLGTSLAQVSILSELGRRQLESEPQAVAALLAEIGGTARELMDALADIVWSVDPRRDDLASAGRAPRARRAHCSSRRASSSGSTRRRRTVAVARARRQLFPPAQGGRAQRRAHAGARVVSLSLVRAGDRLRAEVRDDGVGLSTPPADPTGDRGRGLPNMRQRARSLDAELEVESTPGHGTAIRVVVPLA